MFCPKCGSILLPKKSGKKSKLVCGCGYKTSKQEKIVIKEKTVFTEKDKIEIVDKKVEVLPKTKEECPKCKHGEAYYWTVQTRSGDEAETRFFKCTKCAHTWRVY